MVQAPPVVRTQRLRGRRGMARRAAVLRAAPLCQACQAAGRGPVLATELDHVVPLHRGGPDTVANLAPLCARCHLAKTLRERGAEPRPAIGPDGEPIDPGPHWIR